MNKKAIIIAPRALYVCAPAFDAEPDDEGWYGHVITCTQKLMCIPRPRITATCS